jgi:hypothetical protein
MLGWLKKLRTSSKAEPVATETGDDDAKKEKKLAKSAPALPETNDKKTKSPSSTRKSRVRTHFCHGFFFFFFFLSEKVQGIFCSFSPFETTCAFCKILVANV